MSTIRLPRADGTFELHTLSPPRQWPTVDGPPRSRIAYAAVHVVADPLADNTPGKPAMPDWHATAAFRRHIWDHGLGVAEAMDTAQRGMGLTWDATVELIQRTAAEAKASGGLLACGAGTDHASPDLSTLDEVVSAYEEQIAVVENAGAKVVLMASRQLARIARGPDDYAVVYDRLLSQVREPVLLHWLGPMFDPALDGYWGSEDLDQAAESVLQVIRSHESTVDGIKISLLDADREVAVRESLPGNVRLYTGDDFAYPELIKSGSDALLGIFDGIAPAAAAALQALDRDDLAAYDEILAPTVPLAMHIFRAPTFYYKTGLVFLAWLAGHQDAFQLVSGLHSARSTLHLVGVFTLADAAGLLPDPELATDRMRAFLSVAGFPQ